MKRYIKAVPGRGIVASRYMASSTVDDVQRYVNDLVIQFSEWAKAQTNVEDCGGDFDEYHNYIEFVIIYDDGYVNDTFGISCEELTGNISTDLDKLKSEFRGM